MLYNRHAVRNFYARQTNAIVKGIGINIVNTSVRRNNTVFTARHNFTVFHPDETLSGTVIIRIAFINRDRLKPGTIDKRKKVDKCNLFRNSDRS